MSSNAWSRLIRSANTKLKPGKVAVAGEAAGWFGAEGEGFIRGWCLDRSDPKQRLKVEVLVNATPIGQVVADRLHTRLVEMGEGDGRYGFTCVVPQEYRDGVARKADVRIITPGYEESQLKTRADEVLLQPDSVIPGIAVKTITDEWLDGMVLGVRNRKFAAVDLWVDGKRLPEAEYSLQWMGRSDQGSAFRLRLDGQSPLRLLNRAALSYPGVHEVLRNATQFSSAIAFEVTPSSGDSYRVSVDPKVVLPDSFTLAAQLGVGEDVRGELDLVFRRNVTRFSVPADEGGHQMFLTLRLPDGSAFGDAVRIPRASSRCNLVENCTFARWIGEAPDAWILPDIEFQRGFYAFSEKMRSETGVSGQTLIDHVAAGPSPRLLLRQPLKSAPLPGESDLHFGLLARASQETTVEFRIAGESGATVVSSPASVGTQWSAQHSSVALDGTASSLLPLMFEVWTVAPAPEDGIYIEIAGVRCGDLSTSFGEASGAGNRPTANKFGENLVVNAALQRWPNGLSYTDARRRFEITEGWYFYKRGATSDAQIAAVPARTPSGGISAGTYALSLAVDTVEEHCRVEIALATESLGGALRLRFNAMSGTLFDAPTARFDRGQRWTSIDRISVARRSYVFVEGERTKVDEVVAVVARRVMLTREMESFEFNSVLDEAEQGEDPVEYLLLLEFNRPVSLTMAGVDLRIDDSRLAEDLLGVSTALRLEDRNISSQAPFVKGLEDWIAETAVVPDVRRTDEEKKAAPPERWSWRYSAMGTVEVVVCVYNAADETLECLRSLVGSTTVPHTVHLINDASDSDGRQRIMRFIADKPWMRLSDNPANQGYTASANRGVSESDADWVVLLNSDTMVSKGWLEGLLDAAASDPRVAFVGPVSNAATYQSVPELYDGGGKWAINALPAGWTVEQMAAFVAQQSDRSFPEAPLLNGFCTLIKRNVFLEIGGLDVARFPAGYGEENDLCLRATKSGHLLVIADHVYVYHSKSASFGASRRQELAKAGEKAFRALHDDVNVGNLGRRFAEIPALTILRQRIRKAYGPRDPETAP